MSGARLAAVLLLLVVPGPRAQESYVPSAPQNLTAHNVTSTGIQLSWTSPTTFTSRAILDKAFSEKQSEIQIVPEAAAKIKAPEPDNREEKQNDAPVSAENALKPENLVSETSAGPGRSGDGEDSGRYDSSFRDWYNNDRRKFHDDYSDAIDRLSDGEVRKRRQTGHMPRRHRKRRQEATSTERVDNSTKLTSTEANTEGKTNNAEVAIDIVKKSKPPAKPKNPSQISYVLYYEQGFPRSNTTVITGTPSSEEIKSTNFFMSDMQMGDYSGATKNLTLLNTAGVPTKVVGYRLKDLKPLTPYKIWVRAFYKMPPERWTPEELREKLGPRSEPLYVLTDVRPPSAPRNLNLTCDQLAGILYLQWWQPSFFENSLDQYVVSLRRLPEQQPRTRLTIPTSRNEIETTISVVVEMWNVTQYEVIVYAVTLSVVRHRFLINGTQTEPQVVSSALCQARTEAMSPAGGAERASTLVLVTVAMAVLLLVLVLYLVVWGCRSRVSKCITAAYSFLEEGGERGVHAPLKTYKKPVVGCSPLRGCAAGTAAEPVEGAREAPTERARPPRMSCRAHRAVPAREFPRHVAALHADGDIGFSKEYEVVVSRSAALAHSSHHSHRPENRHKNRYLNITAYDHSRVCVSAGGRCGAAGCAGGAEPAPCDYVNANFIDGMLPALDDRRREYIRRKLRRRERPHSRQPSQKLAKPPPNLTEGIESAFLNIEFSGIVESEETRQDSSSDNSDEDEDEQDLVTIDMDGESVRVKLEWLVWRRRYIATQGPTPATLHSFWRMVWQHRAHTLVMITNLVERGRRKCDMYWPSGGRGSTAEFGGVHVTLMHEDVRDTYTVRHLRVRCAEGEVGGAAGGGDGEPETRRVVQYHYTVWPDHGTPAHPLAVLPFVEAASREPHTVLVHCSAGVGRTGTYIALDAQLAQLRLTGTASPLGFLCRARTQRNHLVQTEEQYVFVHDALLERVRSGDTAVPYALAGAHLAALLAPIAPEQLEVLDYKLGESAAELPCENGDGSSVMLNGDDTSDARSDGRSVGRSEGRSVGQSEGRSELRSDELVENGDGGSLTSDEKRLSESVSLKELNGAESGDGDGGGDARPTVNGNGASESEAVYDLAPSGDTFSRNMQAYADMSRAERDECRRANRAENYAILERMRSLAGRRQRALCPPPVNLLEKQYHLITRCCAEPALAARAPHNLHKNRADAALPTDAARVLLVPRPGVEGSEYVNASWVSGRRRLREYAVSQHPPAGAAVADLWRLLWDHTAQLLLVLSDPADGDCEPFWPTQREPDLYAANFRATYVSSETYVARRKCERPSPPDDGPAACYRRRESAECADDERLIPEGVAAAGAAPAAERVELRLERRGSGGRDLAARKSIANGDLFASLTETRRSPRSPSKMSLKSFKLGSPTRFKFPEWGQRSGGGAGSPPDTAPPPPPPAPSVEEEAETRRPCYYFERVEAPPPDVPSDRLIEVTSVSLHSVQDDYQLTVKVMRCAGWLEGDTTQYEPGRPDDSRCVREVRAATTDAARDAALERLTEPYRDTFALVEFVAGRQMEYKNGPVVVVDKYGGWRALSFCTLSAACGGARAADAPLGEYDDPADECADVYRWAALSAGARASLSPAAPAHSPRALLAQYAALARYGRLLRPAAREDEDPQKRLSSL